MFNMIFEKEKKRVAALAWETKLDNDNLKTQMEDFRKKMEELKKLSSKKVGP